MKLFFILGNQLFPLNYLNRFKKDHLFFLAEDKGLCTYEKHHKHKILLFLSSMRSYADKLNKNKFKLDYVKLEDKEFNDDYLKKLKKIILKKKIKEVSSFEIEDKFFEKKISKFFKKEEIEWKIVQTPMFINSRDEFKNNLQKSKKPFMASFYKEVRKKSGILLDTSGNPVGGKWSFDEDNRNKLPKNISISKFPKINETNHTKKLKPIIESLFKDHPGSTDNFWFATNYEDVLKLLNFFIKEKINLFGDYEDAVSQRDNILFHSALSPLINTGLITPIAIIDKLKNLNRKVKLNSLEGYVRQVIGWREFMRGIYQNYSIQMEKGNFFNHKRKFKKVWYSGDTGIPPLDHSIRNAIKYGWVHHIERLMILSSLMNLCEIEPKQIYKWFMEMFVDASEWVMVPNVYGMGLFSDGGIFATKPYICGSSYYLKMMDFKKGEWCETVDGLYWRFINKNRKFFSSNPRLNMMVTVYDKMNSERKKKILLKAENFINQFTS